MDSNDAATLVRYAIKTYELKRRFYIAVIIYVALVSIVMLWFMWPAFAARVLFDKFAQDLMQSQTQVSKPSANDPAALQRKKELDELRRKYGQ